MILSKSDILQGIDTPKQIKIETLGGEMWFRPLSSAEIDEILNIEAKGYGNFNAKNTNRGQTQTEGKMNLAKMQEARAEAKYMAIFKSINNPKNKEEWLLDEIKQLPSDAVNEIYDKVMELSGAEVTTADVKNFPEEE